MAPRVTRRAKEPRGEIPPVSHPAEDEFAAEMERLEDLASLRRPGGRPERVARPRPPRTPDELSAYQKALDGFQRDLLRECALAIGWWLEKRGNLHQPIAALRLHELEGMAADCCSKYADMREAKRVELELSLRPVWERDELDAVLADIDPGGGTGGE